MEPYISSTAKGWRHRIGILAGLFLFLSLGQDGSAARRSEPIFYIRNTGVSYELFHYDLNLETTTKLNPDLPAFASVDDFQVDKKGRLVVYRADAEADELFHLYLKNIADGTVAKITNFANPNGSVFDFQFDPKGKFVVYGADADADNLSSLYKYDIASGETTTLFEMPPGGNMVSDILLNPNRKGVYFEADANVITQHEPYYVEFSSGEVRKLADITINEEAFSATFDPRGKSLYLDIKTINPHHYNLYRHDLKSGVVTHMVVNNPAPIGYPQISQNGKTLVWAPQVGGSGKLQKLDTKKVVNTELDSVSPVSAITMDKKAKNVFYIANSGTYMLHHYNMKTGEQSVVSELDPVTGFVGSAYVDPKSRWLYYIARDTTDSWDLFYKDLKTGFDAYVNGALGPGQRVRTAIFDRKNRFIVFMADNPVTKKQQLYYLDLKIGFYDTISDVYDELSFTKVVVPGGKEIFF